MLAVYTGADTDGVLNSIPCAWIVPDSILRPFPTCPWPRTWCATRGDGVAVVVAENRYQAEDALELITVDYQPLPAVVNPEAAFQPGSAPDSRGGP